MRSGSYVQFRSAPSPSSVSTHPANGEFGDVIETSASPNCNSLRLRTGPIIVCSLLAFGLLVGFLPAQVGATDASKPSMKLAGQLPFFEPPDTPGGWLVLNPHGRRGYQFFRPAPQPFGGMTVIWSFDLDTLRPIRRGTVPHGLWEEPSGSDVLHAVDEEGGKMFFASRSHGDGTTRLIEIDAALFEEEDNDSFHTFWEIPNSSQLFPRGLTLTRDENGSRRILVLLETVPTAQIDPRLRFLSLLNPNGRSEVWRLSLNDICERFRSSEASGHSPQLLRTANAIYLACEGLRGGGLEGPLTIVKVPTPTGLNSIPNPSTREVFTLPRVFGTAIADQARERLLVEASLNGKSIWAFDARADSWVGVTGFLHWTGYFVSLGIDHRTGRFYVLVPDHPRIFTQQAVRGGFQFADFSLTPIPQVSNAMPELAYHGQFRISVDPEEQGRSRRVFVRRGGTHSSGIKYPDPQSNVSYPRESFYTIVEDTIPVATPPPPAEPDRNTVGQKEEPNVTDAHFEASGSGFGFRALWIGGVNGMTSGGYRDGPTYKGCLESQRELVMGWVPSAKLSHNVASASAISFDADLGTRDDLRSPVNRCWSTFVFTPPPNEASAADSVVGEEWRTFAAECVGTEENERSQGSPGKFTQPTGRFNSEAECNQEQGTVGAMASGSLGVGEDSAPVRIASATSTARVIRDPEGGVSVTVISVAKGIEIPRADFRLARIEMRATSVAGGRPGTARTEIVRTICPTSTSCTTNEAQQREMIDNLNRALGPLRGRAVLRSPDPDLSTGSPGGYLSGVRRHRREGPYDRDVNRDYSMALPGLEIVFARADSPRNGPGRHIYQFAAVQAEAAYGIYCILGQATDGKCNVPVGDDDFVDELFDDSVDPESSITLGVSGSGGLGRSAGVPFGGPGEIVRRIIEKIAEGLRLLFSSPKEAALMAAVWLLFWIPSYLGERRRLLLGV